jgi:CBS domain-containing protein
MGSQSINKFEDSSQRRFFTKRLLRDIEALEVMLRENMFETGIQRIGAEQELVLLQNDWTPAVNNVELLEKINDEHYTLEIAKFNLEINMDPLVFEGSCFSDMEKELLRLLMKGHKVAEKHHTKIALTGILPTLMKEHLHFEFMTPNPRYKALNDVMYEQKGGDFELNIEGLDELITKHQNILFEACNTSFQVHLQMEPDEFVDQYNWSQMISGPVLSVLANSPLLLGKRLWSETRIALFQQSVDTRNAYTTLRNKQPRVSFGNRWVSNSVTDLYKENVSRFNLLFGTDLGEDSMDLLEKGEIPKLTALNLHNGTVYKWNRPCYGVGGGKPHLRIENRYIPSGPTVQDEIANSAFWLGVMKGMPEEFKNMEVKPDFEEVRFNFYNAARRGLESQFNWFGKILPAKRLIERHLLPYAYEGLAKMNVSDADISRYLKIIEGRLKKKQTGASWTRNNFSQLIKGSTPNEASRSITKKMYEWQQKSLPVHQWKNLDIGTKHRYKEFERVKDVMETDLFTASEDDPIELVVKVMNWQNIRHIPVENPHGDFIGLVDPFCLIHMLSGEKSASDISVKDVMIKDITTVLPESKTSDAINIMADQRLDSLCVVNAEGKLVGIITESDIIQVLKITKRLEEQKN